MLGANGAVIVGNVIDSFGRPLAGATVSFREAAFRATTAADGTFTVPYAPGTFHIVFDAPGCARQSLELNVTQAMRYLLDTKMLMRLPETSPETVSVALEDHYAPLPPVTFEARDVTFGPTFPNRCAEFTLVHPVPTIRGRDLVLAVPDRNFGLVRVQDERVTTDPYPYTVGVCPGRTERLNTLTMAPPEHTFLAARRLAPATYCFIRWPRADPARSESRDGYCFRWELDPTMLFGSSMTEPEVEPGAPPEQLGDMSDHGA